MNLLDGFLECEWEYIGCGAANVVFAYIGTKENLRHKVARLRLNKSMISTKDIYNYLHSENFKPFQNYMVEIHLCLVKAQVLRRFQKVLDSENLSFRIDDKEDHVLILDNLFSSSLKNYECFGLSKYHKLFVDKFENDIIFEFKPKWLYDLPKHHNNCRNCLNAKLKNQEFISCHLKLLNSEHGIEEWCNEIHSEFSSKYNSDLNLYELLKKCLLKNYELIHILFNLQKRINIHQKLESLGSIHDVDDELQFHMTIRDVSLFLKLSFQKIYVLDLDKKPKDKWESWKKQEIKFQRMYSKNLNLNCRIKANV